eukprot:TRINITY_DN1140_c0_g1_i1.p1 TRINITY_DN1140_c0_g1~~TRINITY_DN1140_c0_g1_i1.p1  ORF type:complete len:1589 (+),score=551.59 TRINITY_DN1140_c0_g1_i1:139-4905(+)
MRSGMLPRWLGILCAACAAQGAAPAAPAAVEALHYDAGCSGGNGTKHLVGCAGGALVTVTFARGGGGGGVRWVNVDGDAEPAGLECEVVARDAETLQCRVDDGGGASASGGVFTLAVDGAAVHPAASLHLRAKITLESVRYDKHRCEQDAASNLTACEMGAHLTLRGAGFSDLQAVTFQYEGAAGCAAGCEILHRGALRLTCQLVAHAGAGCSLTKQPVAAPYLHSGTGADPAGAQFRFAVLDQPRVTALDYTRGCSNGSGTLTLSDCRNHSAVHIRGEYLTVAGAARSVVLLSGRGPQALCNITAQAFDAISCELVSSGLGLYHVEVATSAGTSEEEARITLAPQPRVHALSHRGGCAAAAEGEGGRLRLLRCANRSAVLFQGVGIGYAEAEVVLQNTSCTCAAAPPAAAEDGSEGPDRKELQCALECPAGEPAQALTAEVHLAGQVAEETPVIEFIPPPQITKVTGCGAYAAGQRTPVCGNGESITIFGKDFTADATAVYFIALAKAGEAGGDAEDAAGARSHASGGGAALRPVEFEGVSDGTDAAAPAPYGRQDYEDQEGPLPSALRQAPAFAVPVLPAPPAQLRTRMYKADAVCKPSAVADASVVCTLRYAGLPQPGVEQYGVYVVSAGGASFPGAAAAAPPAAAAYPDAVRAILAAAQEEVAAYLPVVALSPQPYVTFLKGCLRVDETRLCVVREGMLLALYGAGFATNPALFGGGALLETTRVTLHPRAVEPDDDGRQAAASACRVEAVSPHLVLCRVEVREGEGDVPLDLVIVTASGRWEEKAAVRLLPKPVVSHVKGCLATRPRDALAPPPDAGEKHEDKAGGESRAGKAKDMAGHMLETLGFLRPAIGGNATQEAAARLASHTVRPHMVLYCRSSDRLELSGVGLGAAYNVRVALVARAGNGDGGVAEGDAATLPPPLRATRFDALLGDTKGERFRREVMRGVPAGHLAAHRDVFAEGGYANRDVVVNPIAAASPRDDADPHDHDDAAGGMVDGRGEPALLEKITAQVAEDGGGVHLGFAHGARAGRVGVKIATDGGAADFALQVRLLPRPVVEKVTLNCTAGRGAGSRRGGGATRRCVSGGRVTLTGAYLHGPVHVLLVHVTDEEKADLTAFDAGLQRQLYSGGDAAVPHAPCLFETGGGDGTTVACRLDHSHHDGGYYPVVIAEGGLSAVNIKTGVTLIPVPHIQHIVYGKAGGCLEGNGTAELRGCSSGTALTIRGANFGAAPDVVLKAGAEGGINGPPHCQVTSVTDVKIVCVLDLTSAAGGFEVTVEASGVSNKAVVSVLPGNLYLMFKNTKLVLAISNAVGWVCTCLWTGSVMVLVHSNYAAKSTAGITADMVLYNVVGLLGWTIFCCYFYVNDDMGVPVFLPDIVYSLSSYACILTLVAQFAIYGGAGPTMFAKLYCGACLSYLARSAAENGLAGSYADVVRAMAMVHLACAAVKYGPQAMYNYQRKSTEGYSIVAVWLDFGGAVLLLVQMFFDGVMRHKWSLMITLNVPKFALAIEVIFFNSVYALQHYVLYAAARAAPAAAAGKAKRGKDTGPSLNAYDLADEVPPLTLLSDRIAPRIRNSPSSDRIIDP